MARPRSRPIINRALATRILATGQSYAAIAATINTVMMENGYASRYDGGSVAHWLTGRHPVPEAIPAVVEAFSRLLDLPYLRPADLGWETIETHADPEPAGPWTGDPITWLIHMGRCDMGDMDRRNALEVGLFSLAAAVVPPPAHAAADGGLVQRAGVSDARRIREMTGLFSDMDDRFGGGHARAALAAYISGHVAPLLRASSIQARPALFSAAAELAYLAGFMASDGGRAGLAQRYYIQAVRLADEAHNLALRATVLRALALQAVELGHPRHGHAYAEAAASALPSGCPLRLRAWITAMRAESAGACGDHRQAHDLLRRAERFLEQADSPPQKYWTGNYNQAALHHQTGTTLALAGDLATAEDLLAASVHARRPSERRSRALIGARLAVIQARRDQPAHAANTIRWLNTDLAMVTSSRVDHELETLRAVWRPARTDPDIVTTDQEVANLLRRRNGL